MDKITKKLLLSVLTVVLTVGALGTTTFAWFTLTNVASVEQFEVDVVADEGIEMRLGNDDNEDTWVTVLTTEMIQEYITDVYGTLQLSGVTTDDGINFNSLGADELVGTGSGYLEIEIDFRSNSADTISWTDVSLDSDGVPFVPNADFTLTNDEDVSASDTSLGNFKAANATRIAIEEQSGTDLDPVIYELSGETIGTPVSGRTNNTYVGEQAGVDFTDDTTNEDFMNGAISYYEAITNDVPFGSDEVSLPDTTDDIAGSPQNVLEMDEDHLGLTTHTYTGGIVIRVWLEGYDPDMYNAILDDTIQIDFEFEGTDAE
ncbi:MAG: hypothetical protein ACLFTZ_03905 [Acholeplasmataceae bacterium]